VGQSFVITLREGLEAALIVAVILAYLRRVDYAKGASAVWWGVTGAVALSLAGAGVIFLLGTALEGRAEEIFEGLAMLVAVGVLGWMVVWMKHQAHQITGRLEEQVRDALHAGSGVALAGLAFVAVGREGLETALFLFAASESTTPLQTLTGGIAGLTIAIVLGIAINRGSRRLNLRAFFNITGVLLIFIAAGLLARGIHELQEAAVVPLLVEHLWDTNHLLNDDTGAGGFLKGILGYNGNPSFVEAIAYGLFLTTTLTYFFWQSIGRRPAGGAARPGPGAVRQ
jgi:high-affinity iron transporter